MEFEIFPCNAQHCGNRKQQQDYFAFSDMLNSAERNAIGCVAVLADGMGGMASGRQAAVTAVEVFMQAYRMGGGSVEESMEKAVYSANQAVLGIPSAGTTLVAAVIKNDQLFWCSVGDSRVYLYRNEKLCQLSRDHNYREELLDSFSKGGMTCAEVWNHPHGEALTAYLGQEPLQKFDGRFKAETLREGDKILLCSDGLYRTLKEEEIVRIFCAEPADPAAVLVSAALEKKMETQDNITVLVLEVQKRNGDEKKCSMSV